jgi:hypothetical protein
MREDQPPTMPEPNRGGFGDVADGIVDFCLI